MRPLSLQRARHMLPNKALVVFSLRLLLPLCFLLLAACQVEHQEIETGYKGAARTNPYLAAEQLLARNGRPTESTTSLQILRDQSPGLIICSLSSLSDRPVVEVLRQQVQRGTHLLVLGEGGETWRNDWSLFSTSPDSNKRQPSPTEHETHHDHTQHQAARDPGRLWLEELGISLDPAERASEAKITLGDQHYSIDQPGSICVRLAADSQARPQATEPAKAEDAPVFVTRRVGSGRVSVLANARPLRNRYLADKDHAALLLALARPSLSPRPNCLILNQTEVSLWRLIWTSGWPCVLAGGLALGLFLWARIPRRQPIRAELEAGDRASFADQIIGTGSFLWQHGNGDILLAALRRQLTSHWRRRHPSVQQRIEAELRLDAAELEQLAKFSGQPMDHLDRLLNQPAARQPAQLEKQVQDLQNLLAQLH